MKLRVSVGDILDWHRVPTPSEFLPDSLTISELTTKNGGLMASCELRFRCLWHGVGVALLILGSSASLWAADGAGAPIPPPPEFTTPDIKPTLEDFVTALPVARAKKLAATDPLLRPPFDKAPVDSLKGMAAGIKAVELDIPNRIRAVQYLGTLDCVTYPQAQEMLIATMQEDPSVEVRYEAVLALRLMLTRGCCNLETGCECESCGQRKKIARETERHAKKAQHECPKNVCELVHQTIPKVLHAPCKKLAQRKFGGKESRYDCCRGCCNEKVLNALANVAYGKDDQCCWIEPSPRVRDAAALGLSLCTTYEAPYAASPTEAPPERMPEGEVQPRRIEETTPPPAPPALEETKPQAANRPAIRATGKPLAEVRQTAAPQPPVVPGLKGYCVVALKSRQFVAGDARFSSVFEDRTYHFSSADAKAAFDKSPEEYAPVYGGLDPVSWLQQHTLVDGQFLREYEGRFYLFVDKAHWDAFKAAPQRFVLATKGDDSDIAAK